MMLFLIGSIPSKITAERLLAKKHMERTELFDYFL